MRDSVKWISRNDRKLLADQELGTCFFAAAGEDFERIRGELKRWEGGIRMAVKGGGRGSMARGRDGNSTTSGAPARHLPATRAQPARKCQHHGTHGLFVKYFTNR